MQYGSTYTLAQWFEECAKNSTFIRSTTYEVKIRWKMQSFSRSVEMKVLWSQINVFVALLSRENVNEQAVSFQSTFVMKRVVVSEIFWFHFNFDSSPRKTYKNRYLIVYTWNFKTLTISKFCRFQCICYSNIKEKKFNFHSLYWLIKKEKELIKIMRRCDV